MKKFMKSTRKFVRNHKEAIVVGAITIPVIALQYKGIQNMNDYLKDHELYSDYYQLTEA